MSPWRQVPQPRYVPSFHAEAAGAAAGAAATTAAGAGAAEAGTLAATVTGGTWTAPIAFNLANDKLPLDPSQFNSLKAGESVVVSGAQKLADGAPIAPSK